MIFLKMKRILSYCGFDNSLLSSGVRVTVRQTSDFFSFGKDFYFFTGLVFFHFLVVIL